MKFVDFFIHDKNKASSATGLVALTIILLSSVLGIFGAFAMTEIGQSLNFPRDWIVEVFRYRYFITYSLIIMLAIVIIINVRQQIFNRTPVRLYIIGIALCLFFINLFAAEIWLRAEHHTAKFISIDEANPLLAENTDVFVLEIDDDARAYPRDWMQIPHIAGDTVGNRDTVMTYCAMSNLPMAFNPQLDGSDTNFRVIAQVHNNLIFTDRHSGELIQQITATAEFSHSILEEYPVQRMPWHAFKQLYPNGQVYLFEPNLLDKITLKLFDAALPSHYAGTPLFPTLRLDDNRLENQEQIWGLKVGNEQMAITRKAFATSPVQNITLSDTPVVAVWFDKYQTVAAFYNDANQPITSIDEIDPYGSTASGKLQRANLYSHVPWMIWSHWFPNTQLIN